MEFLSKYSAETNRVFSAILRLIEVQNTFAQVSKLNKENLVGYADLPNFITSQLSIELGNYESMRLTIKALQQGLSVLPRPLIDFEHH